MARASDAARVVQWRARRRGGGSGFPVSPFDGSPVGVVPRADLESVTLDLAGRIAEMPRLGLALTKKAVNQCEDLMGVRAGMDSVFGLHHFAHAHNAETSDDSLGGLDAKKMAEKKP